MLPTGSFLLLISWRTLLASSVPWSCLPTWWSALRLASPPSHGCRGEIISDYLPLGPPMALPAGPLLAGSFDPSLAAPGWVELAVGPLMGLELEATQLPTITLEYVSFEVFVDRALTSSLLSWVSTISAALGAAASLGAPAFLLALWIVPTEKSSWKGTSHLGWRAPSLVAGHCCLAIGASPSLVVWTPQWPTSLIERLVRWQPSGLNPMCIVWFHGEGPG